MKARPININPALGAVVGAEVIGIGAFAGLPPYRFGWWPATAITLAAVILLLVTVHRRNAAAWVAARSRWMRDRRHTTAVGAAVDISHGGTVYGVRTADNEAVTMIEVDGRPYSPTFLRGFNAGADRQPVAARCGDRSDGTTRRSAAGYRHRDRRVSGAPRHRVPAALQHTIGRPGSRRAAQHPFDRAPRHQRIGTRTGVSPLDRFCCRCRHRAHRQSP